MSEISKETESKDIEEFFTDEEVFVNMCIKRNMMFMKQGMEVIANNRHGYIVGSTGLNLLVKYDKGSFNTNTHPQWNIKYFSEEGDLIKEYK